MKELVEYIAKNIVDLPEEVLVTEEQDDEGRAVLKLEVASDDKGKVIGRQGRIAQAIRTLLRVKAVKDGTRVVLEIV